MSDVVCSITVKVLQYYSDVVCSITVKVLQYYEQYLSRFVCDRGMMIPSTVSQLAELATELATIGDIGMLPSPLTLMYSPFFPQRNFTLCSH